MNMLFYAAHLYPIPAIGKDVAHPLFGAEQLALLIYHDAVKRLGARNGSRIRFHFARQQLEQSRFARPIGADNADPVAALNTQREIPDDRPVAK